MIKSNKLNKEDVFLAFYKKNKTCKQKIIALFGYPVSSIAVVIGDDMYQIRFGYKRVQKISVKKRNKNNYIFINTKYKIKDLEGEWEKEILNQKASGIDTLFIRLRCVRSLRCFLAQLPRKWHYRFGDLLPSIYLNRRLNGR